MQNPKSILFLYLTKRQKAQLLPTLKVYCQKHPDFSSSDLVDKFLEDEKYYLDINNPHFEFIKDYLNSDLFYKELKKYIDYLKYELLQKEKLKPYLEKQKEYNKVLRKKASDFKMSKLKPTKKQLLYYDKLTKLYKLEKKDVIYASRLDLRDWITEIIVKNTTERIANERIN